MKTLACTLLVGLSYGGVAVAGSREPAQVAPPADVWQWFAGGSSGYLTDMDEFMYSLHAGAQRQAAGGGAHAFFLEVGYVGDDADYRYIPPPIVLGGRTEYASFDLNVIPITLNYQYSRSIVAGLNGYAGFGLGVAVVDVESDWSWSQALPPPFGNGSRSEDETSVRFYGDVRAGLSYKASSSLEIYGGVRYVFMDDEDMTIHVVNAGDYSAGMNGDVLVELGVRCYF